MGKRGPHPKPTKLKELAGNPGRRPLPKNEPKPKASTGIPYAPRHLDETGRLEWRRIAKELHGLGLLTNIDLVALSAYCECFSRWIKANGEIQKHGMIVKAQNGFPVQSPWLAISNKAAVEMRKWLVEFGMTPSSRSRVSIDAPAEVDPMEEYLKQGGKPYAVK